MTSRRSMQKASPELPGLANLSGPKSGTKNPKCGTRFPDIPRALRQMFPDKALEALMYFGSMSRSNAARVLSGNQDLPLLTTMLLLKHERGEFLLTALMGGEHAPSWWNEYKRGVGAARRAIALKKLKEEQEKFLDAADA